MTIMARQQVSPMLWRFRADSEPVSLAGESPGRRTFVFAPFGGGSAYALADWARALLREGEQAVALQYPGRGPRAREPHADDLITLAQEAATHLITHTEGPLVLIGHSLGAVICYEIASSLGEHGRDVELLVASAARPPDMQRLHPAEILAMTREDWVQEITVGGNADIRDADRAAIVDLMIPVLRADYLMLARYQPRGRRPVSAPLLAIGGAADPWVARDYLDAWQDWTAARFTVTVLPGGHFYFADTLASSCGAIRGALRKGEDDD
jgi:surfactin synthase thioesterase subunit